MNLKKKIFKELNGIIDRDYVLLDLPNHRNIGDQLIYIGESCFLKQSDAKCVSNSSLTFDNNIFKQEMLLLHGGGNFGDLYSVHQNYRENIIMSYPNNKILIFPQSLHFEDKKRMVKSLSIYNNHNDLIVCARDQYTLDILIKYCPNNNVLLVPDMAFCSSYTLNENESQNKILYLKRKDAELKNENEFTFDFSVDELDWPTYNPTLLEFFYRKFNNLDNRLSRVVFKLINKSSVFGLFCLRDENKYADLGVDFLSKYKFVITTRLHGHILSILLGVPSIIIDNSYGKNKRFYMSWLQDEPLSYFANSEEEANQLFLSLNNAK
ncbi:MAG: polysaccharide pyruvyl transferase family protein [Flavobacteriales bacterium]|jgi:exopolysaccharide biosynthesis predicted pyruvyltransferase EpsI|tara:strand:+ start:651 stop:1619 length:969 start_codon:yes stop_codon:yes gene_type:complete